MILFVVDQVAGAEYIAPLIKKWRSEGRNDWKVLASSQSSSCLSRNDVPHEVLQNCTYEEAVEWIRLLSPHRALVSTSANSYLEYHFVRALQASRIHCAQLIDNWVNFAARFQVMEPNGAPIKYLPDCILTLDAVATQRMIAEGLPEDRIRIIGQPHWEQHLLKARAAKTEVEPGSAILLTQPISHFFGKSLGYDEIDFVRCCLESWKALGINWSQLHLLIHPSESSTAYDGLLNEFSRSIQIVQNSDLQLGRYALTLGMFTSMLSQSLLERVPAVSVQPNAVGADKCFLSDIGIIPRFVSRDDLTHYLREVWPVAGRNSEAAVRFEAIVEGSLARLEKFLLNDFC